MPFPVMSSMRFRPPPGLERELPPPPGLELPCHDVAAKVDADGTHSFCSSPRREISYASTADTDPSELRRATSSASTSTDNDTAEAFEYRLGELVDSPAYVRECAAAQEYIPGRLLRRAASQDEVPPPPPPPPVALELEKRLEGSGLLHNPGSIGHMCGQCHPCEFFHRGRCTAGVDCKFCHLCGPDEAKARRKAKKAMMRRAGAFC
jgi:hypothetical protein